MASGTMTPVSGGAPTGTNVGEPLPYTLLSIHRYARIMGIAPLHFARGATPGLNPIIFPDQGCGDIWFKYDWQNHDRVSWYQLAQAIQTAEEEIANIIGYYPAPYWIEQELINFPRPFMRDAVGTSIDVRSFAKGVTAQYGKFLQSGQRSVSLIGTATVAGGSLSYTDEDSDGFYETATITLPTSLTDIREIKPYISGMSGVLEWEIRPVRSKTLSGGLVRIVLDSWLLIDPELYESYPSSDGLTAIDVSDTSNFVTSVDVYREYADLTSASAQFYWEKGSPALMDTVTCQCGGVGCEVCSYTTQDGCLNARDHKLGVLVPFPATYDSDAGAWKKASWVDCREPDMVKIWYRAGARDKAYIRGTSHEPLSLFWAEAIAWLATARLERPFCGCSNLVAVSENLQRDLLIQERDNTVFVTQDIMQCPFGTRRGEVMAWRRIKRALKDRRFGTAVI